MLEHTGMTGFVLLSVLSAATAVILLRQSPHSLDLPEQVLQSNPWRLKELFGFRDELRSRLIFSIDGVFLYLQSYFWLTTMFFIVRQSFWQLGILAIGLAVAFCRLFYLIKNKIEKLHTQRTYTVGVFLYTPSWLLQKLSVTIFYRDNFFCGFAILNKGYS